MSALLGLMLVVLVSALTTLLDDSHFGIPALAVRAPGSPALADPEAAAQVIPTAWELRHANERPNGSRPTRAQLNSFRAVSQSPYAELVTGAFTGTTGEILQWGAAKWGLDYDVLRSQAAAESGFRQSQIGDGGLSFGMLQIKRTVWKGTWPLTQRSTAFNVDMHGAIMRECLDGRATWLGRAYRAGNLWGCVGYYFSGRWNDPEGRDYVRRVRLHLRARALREGWLGLP